MSAFYSDTEVDLIGIVTRDAKGIELTMEEMDNNLTTLLDVAFSISKGEDPVTIPAYKNAISPIIADGELASGDITFNIDFVSGYAVIKLEHVDDSFHLDGSNSYITVKDTNLGIVIDGGSSGWVECVMSPTNHSTYTYIVFESFGEGQTQTTVVFSEL